MGQYNFTWVTCLLRAVEASADPDILKPKASHHPGVEGISTVKQELWAPHNARHSPPMRVNNLRPFSEKHQRLGPLGRFLRTVYELYR